MKISRELLKEIIQQEIVATSEEEVLVRGYGYLSIDRIRKKLSVMLAEAAEQAAQNPPKYTHLNSGVIFALHEALKENNALNIGL